MNCKQDMPPPGGYAPIVYKRVPLKPGMSALTRVGVFLGISGLGWAGFLRAKDVYNDERLEMRCAAQAIEPMVLAELDRIFLKQIRKNRDMEEELMKDVKDWEVGKWKHTPVYVSLGADEFYKPIVMEYFAHGDPKITYFLLNFSQYF